MRNIKFGTGGFRAIIGEDFTKDNVQAVCQAIANIISNKNLKKEICIGYDNRFMSEKFAEWGAEVFAGNGIAVEFFDCATSTPVAMYATKINNNDYGIMITASHNPYEYNGVKVFVSEGKDASVDETSEIEEETKKVEEIKTLSFEEALGKQIIKNVNYIESYLENIFNLIGMKDVGKGFNVVFDSKFGSTTGQIDTFAEMIGLTEYEIINGSRDAFFGFKAPAPNPNNIDELKDQVILNEANIGFALDADGDRLAVVDEKGNYIDNNYILAIVYYFFTKYCGMKGGSVKNIATSNLLDIVTANFGYVCTEVPVGFKWVSSALRENNAVVGGESSGGLAIHGHIWGKDSLLAIAICLKAMHVMGKTFSAILEEVKDFAGGYNKVIFDRQYKYTSEQRAYIDDVLFNNKKTPKHRFEVDKIVFDEHIKVYYKNGNWSLIRFSGTEPILRIFVETDSMEDNELIIKDWEELLKI